MGFLSGGGESGGRQNPTYAELGLPDYSQYKSGTGLRGIGDILKAHNEAKRFESYLANSDFQNQINDLNKRMDGSAGAGYATGLEGLVPSNLPSDIFNKDIYNLGMGQQLYAMNQPQINPYYAQLMGGSFAQQPVDYSYLPQYGYAPQSNNYPQQLFGGLNKGLMDYFNA